MSSRASLGWPNRLSIARIVLVLPFVWCLLHLDASHGDRIRWAAIAIFVIMAVSDGLDGFLARRLKQESALGRFLDPIGDKLLIIAAVVVLTVSGIPTPQPDGSADIYRL